MSQRAPLTMRQAYCDFAACSAHHAPGVLRLRSVLRSPCAMRTATSQRAPLTMRRAYCNFAARSAHSAPGVLQLRSALRSQCAGRTATSQCAPRMCREPIWARDATWTHSDRDRCHTAAESVPGQRTGTGASDPSRGPVPPVLAARSRSEGARGRLPAALRSAPRPEGEDANEAPSGGGRRTAGPPAWRRVRRKALTRPLAATGK